MLLQFFKYISARYDAIVFAVEYTGYGPTHTLHPPSMPAAYDDVAKGIAHAKAAEPALPLLIWARSMGCAPVIRAVANNPAGFCAGLILESPFLSPLMTVFPFRLFFETDFESIDEVQRLEKLPILFIHGERDTVVPMWHSKRLFDLCGSAPKQLVLVPNGTHNDLFGNATNRAFVERELDNFALSYILSRQAHPDRLQRLSTPA